MSTSALRKSLNRLRQVLTVNDLTDAELLNRFIADRDEAAFAVLVRRHGSLVMGVARRALGNLHDAEDVFQATFLFLAQKARSVINRQALPGWLHTVAYRTALAARERIQRRRKREQQVEDMPHPEARTSQVQDWQSLLDAELSRLPDKYRLPVILCDLESRPRKEVCRQLRLAEGTLSSRLSTARRKLAERLTRRGVTLSVGAIAATLSESMAAAIVPVGVANSTAKTAVLVAAGQLTAVSGSVLYLMQIGAKAMFLSKLKATIATVVVLAFVGGGIVYSGSGGQPQPKNDLEALRRENELLKVNLRVTLEKIEALENQLRTFKGQKNVSLPSNAQAAWFEVAELLKRRDAEAKMQQGKAQDAAAIAKAKEEELRRAEHDLSFTMKQIERNRQLEDALALLRKLVEAETRPSNRDQLQRAADALQKLRTTSTPDRKPETPGR